jgi:hypothetical protein
MNEEHKERLYTVISKGSLEIFSSASERMSMTVLWLDTLMDDGKTTEHTRIIRNVVHHLF